MTATPQPLAVGQLAAGAAAEPAAMAAGIAAATVAAHCDVFAHAGLAALADADHAALGLESLAVVCQDVTFAV